MNDIVRRDPRAEWIARNRLHPLHAAMHSAQGGEVRWMGPHGLVRKNPHAVGFVGPNGIRRIDRSGGQQGSGARRASVAQEAQLPLHVVEQPAFLVAVVPDMVGGRLSSHDKDLLGLARKLAGNDGAVLAVVFGEHKESAFDSAGVDRLLHLAGGEYDGYAPEQRILALRNLENQLAPRHWLFPDSRNGGGELGRRRRGREDIQRALPRLLLAAAECAEPVSETRHEARELHMAAQVARNLPRIEDLGPVAVDPARIPMAEAEFILSGGNGVQDWTLFHQAAAALGATEGASRVAVDDGHMPRNRQVGATGTWVTARVYLAVGISGAIQHLQGIGACDKVVAVNRDAGCDMIKRADLSVIGDSTEILRALIRLAEAHRNGAARDAA